MERLCERPGCSDPASVAYGMRPEDLVFWLEALTGAASDEHRVLCRRHADSMVVPRGWTLDDLRDPDLHLFRPPGDVTQPIPRPRPRPAPDAGDHRQLVLHVDDTTDDGHVGPDDRDRPDLVEPLAPAPADTDTHVDTDVDEAAGPWMPVFDTDDDLDGLLSARSPLLARAFRGERLS